MSALIPVSSSQELSLSQARDQSIATLQQGFPEWLKVIAESSKADSLAKIIFQIKMIKSVKPKPTIENEGSRIKVITSIRRENVYTLEDKLELTDKNNVKGIEEFFLDYPKKQISDFIADGLDFAIMLDVRAYGISGRCFAPISQTVTFCREGAEPPKEIEMFTQAQD